MIGETPRRSLCGVRVCERWECTRADCEMQPSNETSWGRQKKFSKLGTHDGFIKYEEVHTRGKEREKEMNPRKTRGMQSLITRLITRLSMSLGCRSRASREGPWSACCLPPECTQPTMNQPRVD